MTLAGVPPGSKIAPRTYESYLPHVVLGSNNRRYGFYRMVELAESIRARNTTKISTPPGQGGVPKAKKTATFVRGRLGLGLDVVSDDQDEEWATDSEIGSEEKEMWRVAEKTSRLEKASKGPKNAAVGMPRYFTTRNLAVLFRHWSSDWRIAIKSFQKKFRSNSPQAAYDARDRLLWRILHAVDSTDQWVDLPGPAKDWPRNFDDEG
ncbi:MAG: hypothetical protein M1816_003030 [Peltula sp. TS41687]|nr:MAG: hypothetical protein M1816_003030 [Peltula sp. TS41687]